MLAFDFSPFPVLETERLVLRAIGAEDVPEMFALRSDPRVMRYVMKPLARSHEEVAEVVALIQRELRANRGLSWAITRRGSPKLIGQIGYWPTIAMHHRAEVGYMLAPEHWGRGLMREALARVLEHGFGVLRLHSVGALCDPRNEASTRLLERCGFVREGLFREDCFFEGRFLDTAVYSLLCPEAREV